ncbi:methyltransferase domain-containing protein [Mycobacterium simiae]|uniref:Methyltransferase domain-containing protein n=1 Tax=Mycobacterium simiae TaxID=1784 RepID=A0A5B1BRA3_MYCSI|nr:methyltransferase domain-containing protein [Mycobacterium simiae]
MTTTKRDHNEVFLEYTKSICPVCKVVVDAQVNVRDGKVYLRKRCREHGEFEALVYGDAQMYLDSARFNKPGTISLQFQTEIREGCPSDCGLCPDHKQHACLGLIEVNSHCNLDCPICFADSGHQPDGYALTLAQCEKMLDTLVAAEGEPEVVMLSGGEPTIHKQILDFVDAAQARPIKTVIINTNGIRLASDRQFIANLAERNRPGGPVHIYLQFDGLEETTHRQIRGRDLRDIKARALDNCAAAGLTVSLVAAVERGINDHELGAVIRHGMAQPAVQSVVFQPVTHAGRHVQFDPLTRLTNSDIVHGIAAQLPDWFQADDFFPVPCCFPTCRSITYLLTDGEHVVPIPRLLAVEEYLDYVSNRVIPDLAIREALEKLWSASAVLGTATTIEQLQKAAAALDCANACGINLPEALANLTDRVFAIVIQDFQDPYTLNVKQLMKCCVQQLTPDGRLIPFCAYNSVGYREQVRAQLTGVPVPGIVPNAAPLAGLLADSPHGSKQVGQRATPTTVPPQQIKTCCADAYSRDIVTLLLGDSYHPGGARLTRRLADQLELRAGQRVADIAAGPGSTARLLATEYQVTVDAVELSEINVTRAQTAVAQAGLQQLVQIHHGDAEDIPLPDNTFDGLVCECALCTFPDKAAAAQQFARILRPGGLVGITDVTITDAGLPLELTSLSAWVACIADARSVTDYTGILERAGLRIRHVESHDKSLLDMIDRIDARITALAIAAPKTLADNGIQPETVRAFTGLARDEVKAGRLGYTLMIAEKP